MDGGTFASGSMPPALATFSWFFGFSAASATVGSLFAVTDALPFFEVGVADHVIEAAESAAGGTLRSEVEIRLKIFEGALSLPPSRSTMTTPRPTSSSPSASRRTSGSAAPPTATAMAADPRCHRWRCGC